MLRSSSVLCLCLAFSLCALLIGPTEAQPPPSQEPSASETPEPAADTDAEEGPIDIRAEEADIDQVSGVSKLMGHVQIERPTGYLNADEVTIYRDMEDPEQPITRIVAKGHVDLKDGDLVATCEEAIFDEIEKTVELKRSVTIYQKQDRYEADNVVVDRESGKYHLTGNVKFKVMLQTEEEPTEQEEDGAAAAEKESGNAK